jgi:hypothetical protein
MDENKATDWKQLIMAAGLVVTVAGIAGSVFRSQLLSDMDVRIAAHTDSANTKRAAYFQGIESAADRAIDRIGQLEQNCAKFQDWRISVDSRVAVLDDWRHRCASKQSEFTQWMGSDSRDVEELKRDIRELRDAIGKRK